ncbi:IS66 family transposase [Thermoflavifilum aggregans]|uniref:IS66 family transposase n=1 Tax=Thermoflavifilum aggregans TaxID=454188 RepID=UPI000C24ABBC
MINEEKYEYNAEYIHVDETTIKVLDKSKRDKTHLGYFWVYSSSINELAWLDYQPGRNRGELAKNLHFRKLHCHLRVGAACCRTHETDVVRWVFSVIVGCLSVK